MNDLANSIKTLFLFPGLYIYLYLHVYLHICIFYLSPLSFLDHDHKSALSIILLNLLSKVPGYLTGLHT